MITAEAARLLIEEAGVSHWNVRSCIICGARAGYIFEAGQPPRWRGKHARCSEPHEPPQPRTWQDVADDLNQLPVDVLDDFVNALEALVESEKRGSSTGIPRESGAG